MIFSDKEYPFFIHFDDYSVSDLKNAVVTIDILQYDKRLSKNAIVKYTLPMFSSEKCERKNIQQL